MKKLKLIAAVLGLSVLFAACSNGSDSGSGSGGSGNGVGGSKETPGEVIDRDSELKNIQIIPIELDKEYDLTE